ncbi:MAG: hypothetical protein JZU63_02485, partial [Rhodoferax sp.]|nr:hypothetical protein [Rhodoferax sp.]
MKSIIGLRIQAVPYFDQFFVLEAKDDQSLLAGYPASASANFQLYPDEISGMLLASNGVLTQIYSILPVSVDDAARVSFLVAIVDGLG